MAEVDATCRKSQVIQKKLTIIMLLLMALLVIVPVAFMDHEKEKISDIDNRRLQEWSTEPELVEGYFSDRIGFRKEMIGAYSVLNDELFNVMEHPTYEYGKDGYVFFKFSEEGYDKDFLNKFADYIASMRDYCEDRGIAFLYVISPEKARVYAEYVPDYIGDLSHSSDMLKPLLEDRGVEYVDLGDALIEAKASGAQVFNVVYDAGHWNSEGVYAGAQAVVAKLNEMGYDVDQVQVSDYERIYEEQTTLPASYYPINEVTYKYQHIDSGAARHLEEFTKNLVIDDRYNFSAYYESDFQVSAPSILMFQGSYHNYQGTILQHQFSAMAQVHDYQNVFNLPYYVDVFQPDVVIFENADYTVSNSYYDEDLLSSVKLPAPFKYYESLEARVAGPIEVTVEDDGNISNFSFALEPNGVLPEAVYVECAGVVREAIVSADGVVWWGAKTSDCVNLDDTMIHCVYSQHGYREQSRALLDYR